MKQLCYVQCSIMVGVIVIPRSLIRIIVFQKAILFSVWSAVHHCFSVIVFYLKHEMWSLVMFLVAGIECFWNMDWDWVL